MTQHSGTTVVEFDTATMATQRSFTVGRNVVSPALR